MAEKGFFAIGDPDQSIYGFRGAAGNIAQKFKTYWPDLIEITLEDNYRSAQAVLDASASILENPPKLIAHKNYESDMHLFFRSGRCFAKRRGLLTGLKHLLGATSHSLGDSFGHGTLSPGDIAILVRF